MSEIAVKIKRNVAASPPPYTWVDEDFYDYEVLEVPIFDGRQSIVKILGTGKPKIINRSGYGSITITFRLFSTNLDVSSTLTKLKNLELFTGDAGRLIIYPLYVADPSFVRVVVLPKGQIPDVLGVSGRHSGKREITVKFLEIEKSGGGTIIEEGDL